MALSSGSTMLFTANTPNGTLETYDVTRGGLVFAGRVSVRPRAGGGRDADH